MLISALGELSLADARELILEMLNDLELSGVTELAQLHLAFRPYRGNHLVRLYEGGAETRADFYGPFGGESRPTHLSLAREFKRANPHRSTTWRLVSDATPEERELLNWVQNFAIEHLGEPEAADRLMGRFLLLDEMLPEGKLLSWEFDKARSLRNIVELLTQLLGSERAAANWLIHNQAYKDAIGSDIWQELEDGDYNASLLLEGALRMLVRRRADEGTTDTYLSPHDLIPFGMFRSVEEREMPTAKLA